MIQIFDQTYTIVNVCLWKELAEMHLTIGDLVLLKNGKITFFNKEKLISMGANGILEINNLNSKDIMQLKIWKDGKQNEI